MTVLTVFGVFGVFALGRADAQSRCSHPLSPVEAGWVWTYRSTAEGGKVTPYEVRRAASGEGFRESWKAPGAAATELPAKCEAGNITSLAVPSFGSGIRITSAKVTGYTLPAATEWQTGKSWNLTWNLEGRRGVVRGTGALRFTYKLLGRERVTVPAGTFQAWKVSEQLTLEGQVAGINLKPPGPPQVSTAWYAEGVGLVKRDWGKGNLTELVALKK